MLKFQNRRRQVMNFRLPHIKILALPMLLPCAMSGAQQVEGAVQHARHHFYRVTDLGIFGGPNAFLQSQPISQVDISSLRQKPKTVMQRQSIGWAGPT
jgi:hypothetical protein